jgi:hypothetical protein
LMLMGVLNGRIESHRIAGWEGGRTRQSTPS